jgi:hypothetical protein
MSTDAVTPLRQRRLLRCIIFSRRESGVGKNLPLVRRLVCLLPWGADMVR